MKVPEEEKHFTGPKEQHLKLQTWRKDQINKKAFQTCISNHQEAVGKPWRIAPLIMGKSGLLSFSKVANIHDKYPRYPWACEYRSQKLPRCAITGGGPFIWSECTLGNTKYKIQAKTPTMYDHRVIQGSICMIGMYSRKNNRLNLKKVTNVLIPLSM